MKTQQQAQEIFDVLVTGLKSANTMNREYFTRNIHGLTMSWTPLEFFLNSVQKKLASDDCDRVFLSEVYAKAFHTSSIPKNRNHIAMTCQIQGSSILKFWIDLDIVATQLNTHFNIHPPYSFKVRYSYSAQRDMGSTFIETDAVNSLYDNFSLNCMLSCVNDYKLILINLAVASLMIKGTNFTANAGIGLIAGVTGYGIFKSLTGLNTNVVSIGYSSESIVDIFQQHFAVDGDILPQDRVEILDERSLTM